MHVTHFGFIRTTLYLGRHVSCFLLRQDRPYRTVCALKPGNLGVIRGPCGFLGGRCAAGADGAAWLRFRRGLASLERIRQRTVYRVRISNWPVRMHWLRPGSD